MAGQRKDQPLRETLDRVIFGIETPSGKAYDVFLLVVISLSVAVAMAASVSSLNQVHWRMFRDLEWAFTFFFTADYLLRLYSARKRLAYAYSFTGIVDFVSFVPTYLSILIPGTQFLVAVRFLRMLRVFRVLNLSSFQTEIHALTAAMKASRNRILVFVFFVLVCVVVLGSMMYVIEGPENGFTSIPMSIYWAVVTLTTVGYGDLSPQTPLGQMLSNVIMLLGYSIIVIPTGIVATVGAAEVSQGRSNCTRCGATGHRKDARFCYNCGGAMG